MQTAIVEKIGKDLKSYVVSSIESMAESHLECWKDRYAKYGGNRKRLEEDLYTNHDSSLEIERAEEDLKRELNGKEHDYLVSSFNKEVVKQWKKGSY